MCNFIAVPFSSQLAGLFTDTDHFETNELNDSRINFNHTKSKMHHIGTTSALPDPDISRVALRRAICGLQTIWRQVHRLTPK